MSHADDDGAPADVPVIVGTPLPMPNAEVPVSAIEMERYPDQGTVMIW